MKYWQLPARRLSTAARKLEADGAWHPFHHGEHSWYRIGKGRMLQRVQFIDENEERGLMPSLEALDPLPDLARVAGFREEVNIEQSDEGFVLSSMIGYELPSKEAQKVFRQAIAAHNLVPL